MKLHNFKVSKEVTGGNITFVENNSKITRYFLSKTNDVVLNNRDAIGGFYELQFQNGDHDFDANTNNADESDMATGKTVDLTQKINDFKTQFGADKDYYLYFFCPFIKEDAPSTDFKVKFDLNKDVLAEGAVTPYTKQELDDKMYEANTGKKVLRKSDDKSPDTTKQRWDKILAEVKSSGSVSQTQSNMSASPKNYSPIIERKLQLKVGTDNAPNVESVRIKLKSLNLR